MPSRSNLYCSLLANLHASKRRDAGQQQQHFSKQAAANQEQKCSLLPTALASAAGALKTESQVTEAHDLTLG